MANKTSTIIVIVVLAVLVTLQLRSTPQYRQAVSPKAQESLSVEVAQAFADNTKLSKQLTKTEDDLKKLEAAASSSQSRRETLGATLKQLKMVNGSVTVVGEGVEITLEKGLTASRLVDLLNSLRNLGAEAIALNGQRQLWKDGVDDKFSGKPLTVQAIGKRSVMIESLERRGGVLEQIGQPYNITEHDHLKIKAR